MNWCKSECVCVCACGRGGAPVIINCVDIASNLMRKYPLNRFIKMSMQLAFRRRASEYSSLVDSIRVQFTSGTNECDNTNAVINLVGLRNGPFPFLLCVTKKVMNIFWYVELCISDKIKERRKEIQSIIVQNNLNPIIK